MGLHWSPLFVYIDSKEIVLGEMGANLIKGLNWGGVLEECKYQNIPETMAGTPSPPTRGDLESYKKKKKAKEETQNILVR